jgi:hypothetical protein
MAPRPSPRDGDLRRTLLALRPPPGTQEAESVSQANVATLDMSASNEDPTALAIREKPKPRRANLPVRLMSQTSGVAKKQSNKAPSTPALTERIEHSLAVVARSGDTSNVSISEARPSFAREPAPSVEAPPSRTTVVPRRHRGGNPRWRAGDASDAVDSKFNPMLALDSAPLNETVTPRHPRGSTTVAPTNPRGWESNQTNAKEALKAMIRHPEPRNPDKKTLGFTPRRGDIHFDRNTYILVQIHNDTPQATVAGDIDAEREEKERRVAEARGYAAFEEANGGGPDDDDFRFDHHPPRRPHRCGGCRQLIVGPRFQCWGKGYFNLCFDCSLSPNAAYKHREEVESRIAQEGREADVDMGGRE